MSIVSHLQLEEKTECRKEDMFRQPAIVATGVLYFPECYISTECGLRKNENKTSVGWGHRGQVFS